MGSLIISTAIPNHMQGVVLPGSAALARCQGLANVSVLFSSADYTRTTAMGRLRRTSAGELSREQCLEPGIGEIETEAAAIAPCNRSQLSDSLTV